MDPISDTRYGLYLWENGDVRALLVNGDDLDGRTVMAFSILANQGLSGDHLAITVNPVDDPWTLEAYVMDITAVPDRLTLDVSSMRAGQPATFTVTGATPGDDVYFALSSRYGTTCAPILGGRCLGLRRPNILGSSTADATGTATLVIQVPPAASRSVLIQAVVPDGGDTMLSSVVGAFITP
jgi:hypothetical protein